MTGAVRKRMLIFSLHPPVYRHGVINIVADVLEATADFEQPEHPTSWRFPQKLSCDCSKYSTGPLIRNNFVRNEALDF